MADATRRVFRDATLLAGKDLRLEAKSRVGLAQVLPFGVLVLVVMAFALDAESRLLIEVSPGLFWVTVTFAAVLTVGRSAALEIEPGVDDALRLKAEAAGADECNLDGHDLLPGLNRIGQTIPSNYRLRPGV